MPGPSIFISYSHKDEAWKDRLLTHLTPLVAAGRVEVWNDRRIRPGSEWFTEIENAMNTAAVAICLISRNYLQSSFCTQYEVAPLLPANRAEKARTSNERVCLISQVNGNSIAANTGEG